MKSCMVHWLQCLSIEHIIFGSMVYWNWPLANIWSTIPNCACTMLEHHSSNRCLGIDCIGDEVFKILCDGCLHLEVLDISGSHVTDYWYVCVRCLPYQLHWFPHSFSYILSGSFNTSLQCLKINNCDGINDAAVRKTVSSFTSNNLEDTAMAEDIGLFIHSCPRCCASLVWSDLLLMYCFVTCSLRTIEVHGIYCAPHIASNRTCKVLY